MNVRQGHAGQQHLPVTQLYKKLEVVGKGAYGAVYRGVHISSNTIVALKIIDLDTADDDVADIQREVALLSQLRAENNNITKYYGCWLDGPRVWIVMDFAGGGSIRTLMKSIKNGILDERWIVVIIREVLVALSYLHKSNVIHRDIKAANILVQSTGKVVLCDFGVSALLSTSHSKRTTFIGTPHYMAPEVLSSSSYDVKADIWSLGISLYEMATGSQPLAEIPQVQAITLIPKVKPPRLAEQYGSKDMRDFLSNCLRELPTDRLSADELARTKWIKNASKVPVSSLKELLLRYDKWAQAGGVRQSLAQPAPWELDANRTDIEESSDISSWEFDTVRARASLFSGANDGSDIASPTSTSSAQPPESLRMLFGSESFPTSSSEPFFAGFRRSSPPLNMFSTPSSTSLPDFSGAEREDVDITARIKRLPTHNRHMPLSAEPKTDSESSEPETLETSNPQQTNDGWGLPSITIPPLESGYLSSDNDSPASSTRAFSQTTESREKTARPVRRRASPTNFQFPRPAASKPVFRRASPPPSPSPSTSSNHYVSGSLDQPRSPGLGGSHSAHPSMSASSAVLRKPSLNRQMSVAVMESVGTLNTKANVKPPPPPLAVRSRTLGLTSTNIEADASGSYFPTSKPTMGLKDFLKLSPLPPELILGADMLPPSPSVISPAVRPSTSSSNAPLVAPAPGLGANGLTSSLSPLTSDNLRAVESPFSQFHVPASSITSQSSISSLGPPIRQLDFNSLFSTREETHSELARTVEELAQWLQIVESGLTSILNEVDADVITEEETEENSDLTTRPVALNHAPYQQP